MRTELCDRFGVGCVRFNDAGDLDTVLGWYGVDIVIPAKVPTEGTASDIGELIPAEHPAGALGWLHSVARSHVEVALTPDAPEPLPMPLQNILVSEAHQWMNEIRPTPLLP